MNIQCIDDYTLLLIFEKCSLQDHLNLSLVSRKFYRLVEDYILSKVAENLLLTGTKTSFINNTINALTTRKRCIGVNKKWLTGYFYEHKFFHHKNWFPSYLHLTKDYLYLTNKDQLFKYRRKCNESIISKNVINCIEESKPRFRLCVDITTFTVKDNIVFIGYSDGTCLIWNEDENNVYAKYCQEDLFLKYVTCCDFNQDKFVISSEVTTRLYQRKFELGLPYLQLLHDFKIDIKTLKLSSDNLKIACGKFYDPHRNAMRLFDVETFREQNLDVSISAIYDLLWKDSNVILTGNFDATMRLLDTRIKKSEQQKWFDPFDSSIYCMTYDNVYGILCGVRHGRITLYDLRVPQRAVQLYYPKMEQRYLTPIYSIAADSTQLFATTGYNLRILNFDINYGLSRDYSRTIQNTLIY